MGQESSHLVHQAATASQNDAGNATSVPSSSTSASRPIRSSSSSHKNKFRRPSSLLIGRTVSGKRQPPSEGPQTGKKAKVPGSSAGSDATASSGLAEMSRERLLSCPDLHHHTESEMVKRLERLLSQKVVTGPTGAANTLVGGSNNCPVALQNAMKLFDGANPPKISIASYLQRMVYYLGGIAEQERKCGIDEAVHSDMAVRYVLTAILYVERIQNRTGMVITLYNVHRLLITGTMIAAKVLDDFQPNQKYFADLGGVSTLELSRLEGAFLQLCDYNVNVDPETFAAKYASALERERVFSDVNEALTLGAVFSPRMPTKTLVV